MSFKDRVPSTHSQRVSYPPSRVRKMVEGIRREIAQTKATQATLTLGDRVPSNKARILADLDECLAPYRELDRLLAAADEQRTLIKKQKDQAVAYVMAVKSSLRASKGIKKRHKLTAKENVLADASRLLTRRARGTLGKRQREKLFPGFKRK